MWALANNIFTHESKFTLPHLKILLFDFTQEFLQLRARLSVKSWWRTHPRGESETVVRYKGYQLLGGWSDCNKRALEMKLIDSLEDNSSTLNSIQADDATRSHENWTMISSLVRENQNCTKLKILRNRFIEVHQQAKAEAFRELPKSLRVQGMDEVACWRLPRVVCINLLSYYGNMLLQARPSHRPQIHTHPAQ
jgi:hypothetical protein